MPQRKRRCPGGQHAQSSRWARCTRRCGRRFDAGIVGTVCCAGQDGFVGNGFVGVAGQVDSDFAGPYDNHLQARPAVVNLSIDQKLEPDVAARRVFVLGAKARNEAGTVGTDVKELAWHFAAGKCDATRKLRPVWAHQVTRCQIGNRIPRPARRKNTIRGMGVHNHSGAVATKFLRLQPEIADSIMIQIDGQPVPANLLVHGRVHNFGLGRRR